MYDPARAAWQRILTRSAHAGSLGKQYRDLANILMTGPDSPLRTNAMKQLADSCDNAITLLEKTQQTQGKSHNRRRSPGQSNG